MVTFREAKNIVINNDGDPKTMGSTAKARHHLEYLGNCPPKAVPQCPKEKQEETTMDATIRQLSFDRSYLESRLWDVKHAKDHDARIKFYIDGDLPPETWADLQKRIADGKFIYRQPSHIDDDEAHFYGPFGFVEWRDPNKPADKAGYAEFGEKLAVQYQDALDKIHILDPKDGLKVLEEFKAN